MKRKEKVLFSAGGTGGHLYPAQEVARSLLGEKEILFVGGKLKSSPYFDRETFPFQEITTTTFSFSKPWQVIARLPKLVKGLFQSLKILKTFDPDLVVGFGSYTTLPLLLAARLKRVPIVLHEQNAVPGKVNRLFSRFAKVTAITFPASREWLKGKTERVAFPTRTFPESTDNAWDYFGLDPKKKTLLVFGGSQGGKGLNELIVDVAPLLPNSVQILHFTGKHVAEVSLGAPHVVKPFETRMNLAWEVADLALTRAGAATLSELQQSATPAVLIPFPQAAEDHQTLNAKSFAGGEVLEEGKTTPEGLAATLTRLLENLEENKRALLEAPQPKKTLLELIDETLSLHRHRRRGHECTCAHPSRPEDCCQRKRSAP